MFVGSIFKTKIPIMLDISRVLIRYEVILVGIKKPLTCQIKRDLGWSLREEELS